MIEINMHVDANTFSLIKMMAEDLYGCCVSLRKDLALVGEMQQGEGMVGGQTSDEDNDFVT